jgi:hypothetical protein
MSSSTANSINGLDATKRCNACLKYKPYSEFHLDSQHSSGHRGRCKICIRGVRAIGPRKAYNPNMVPSIRITKSCPCDGCEYEKPCEILALDCPMYRNWQKGSAYKKLPRVPDKHLDGSKPGPGVI